ncbi:MAG: flavodoxin [Methanomicrobiales archaeon]|nr:flavodoxin [Methanomicrobiales archaeon]
MRTLIIYMSVHHQNTLRVATVMAEELAAELVAVDQAPSPPLADYDLIGFGSGIFFGNHHKTLLAFVEALPAVTGKQAFIFSTSGVGRTRDHALLRNVLVERGYSILDEFSCKGWDSWGPLKLVGGINRGRPDAEDLEAARVFARGLKARIQGTT